MKYIPETKLQKIEELKGEGKLDEAMDVVNQILKNDPTNEDMLLQVADIQYIKGEISSAEKPVDFMLKYRGDNNPMSYYVKGVLEMEKTSWSSARKFLKKAMELSDFGNAEIIRCYGLAEYWLGNREKGIDFISKAFELNGYDAEIVYNIIEINLLEHKYEEAREYIDYYHDNYDSLQTFGKDISFYDEKVKLFNEYLKSV